MYVEELIKDSMSAGRAVGFVEAACLLADLVPTSRQHFTNAAMEAIILPTEIRNHAAAQIA